MPDGAVYVGRPGLFGNPFYVDRWGDMTGWLGWYVADPCSGPHAVSEYFAAKSEAAAHAVRLYRAWVDGIHQPENGQNCISLGRACYTPGWVREHAPARLAGHDLACWCPLDQPCHADVLIDLANPASLGGETR